MKKRLAKIVLISSLVISPLFGISQTGPDDPPFPEAVPFDDNMNLLFLAVGIVFAVFFTIKYSRKKTASATI